MTPDGVATLFVIASGKDGLPAGIARVWEGVWKMAKRFPLPKRFNSALSEAAYARLRNLNEEWGLGNNYLLVVLLEHLDEIADQDKLEAVFQTFIDEYGAPSGKMKKPD